MDPFHPATVGLCLCEHKRLAYVVLSVAGPVPQTELVVHRPTISFKGDPCDGVLRVGECGCFLHGKSDLSLGILWQILPHDAVHQQRTGTVAILTSIACKLLFHPRSCICFLDIACSLGNSTLLWHLSKDHAFADSNDDSNCQPLS